MTDKKEASFVEEKVLDFTSKQLYDLAMDVKQYPEFLPWCSKIEIVKTDPMVVDMTIKYGFFSETIRSFIRAEHDGAGNYKIFIKADEGVFKYFQSEWEFLGLADDKCKVSYSLEFKFSNFFIEKAISLVFSKASNLIINSFEQQAKKLYN